MGDQPPSSNFDRHKWKGKCNQVIDILGFFTKLNSLSYATETERESLQTQEGWLPFVMSPNSS